MKVLLADVLTRLAHELHCASQASARLEAVVQEALTAQGSSDQFAKIQSIQHMDLMTQSLADVARFTDKIAAQASDYIVDIEDALAVLHLRAMRQGLAGQRDDSVKDAGHVEVF